MGKLRIWRMTRVTFGPSWLLRCFSRLIRTIRSIILKYLTVFLCSFMQLTV